MTQPQVRIVGAAESPYTRHPPEDATTESFLADAFVRVLADAGLDRSSVDGLGVASFMLPPDRAIDLAWKLGVRFRWLMDDGNGGISGIQLLQHAMRAIEAGDATNIILLSGDHFDAGGFRQMVDRYNRVTEKYLAGIPTGGPNPLFAMITQHQMEARGLAREDYGRLVVAQRRWASMNPGAVYRKPLTLEEYLAAPAVAEPLHRLDCVPVVSGADALVVSGSGRGVKVRALRASYNFDGQRGDGLRTGLSEVADDLWRESGVGPGDVDLISVYDDYPAMAIDQLEDLGFIPDGDISGFVGRRLEHEHLPVNTSGGQLSAGQAGAAGGMIGLVEAVVQLMGHAGDRQVEDARLAVVSGYGMVLYRYGGCANAVVLEAP
ncbi:MAG: thiolase family protein [Acidimicrobiales bacterium]